MHSNMYYRSRFKETSYMRSTSPWIVRYVFKTSTIILSPYNEKYSMNMGISSSIASHIPLLSNPLNVTINGRL